MTKSEDWSQILYFKRKGTFHFVWYLFAVMVSGDDVIFFNCLIFKYKIYFV